MYIHTFSIYLFSYIHILYLFGGELPFTRKSHVPEIPSFWVFVFVMVPEHGAFCAAGQVSEQCMARVEKAHVQVGFRVQGSGFRVQGSGFRV